MLMGYYIGMALLALLLLLLYIGCGFHLRVIYPLAFALTLMSSLGNLALAMSTTIEEALLANRITYFGAVFLGFFLCLIVLDLCRIKISRALVILLTVLNFAVLIFALSPGYSTLYYKSQELMHYGGASYLTKTYGPMHNCYLALWLGYMLVIFIVIGFSIFRQQLVSYKTVITLGLIAACNTVFYIAERLAGIPIELMPLSYCISEILLLARLRSISLYDVSTNVAKAAQNRTENGYLTFTADLKFVACNEFAAKVFPEILHQRIDYPVTDEGSAFHREIIQWLRQLQASEDTFPEKRISHGAQSFKCSVCKIYEGIRDRYAGLLVEICDDSRQQNYIKMIENFNDTLEKEVSRKTSYLQQMQEDIILSFANIVESRDHVTGGHNKRTSGYVRILADQMAKMKLFPELADETYIKDMCMAAPLHDIGKIAIPDSILNKPGKYEPQEYQVMKKHPLLGGNILDETLSTLEDQKYYQIAWQTAMYHHERWDGAGYPTGLTGEEIPLCARVMAIADVFDALTSHRPYKDEFTLEQAFDIIEEGKGAQFDPRLVDAFMACRAEFAAFCIEQRETGTRLSKDDLESLMQTVFYEEDYSNAYQVSYSEWGRFVTYLKKLAIRNKQNMYLIMFTLESKAKRPLTDEQKRVAVVNLKLAVVSSLRSSDMTTQISATQRVILLLNIDQSGIRIVVERIMDSFARQNTDEDIALRYDISNPLKDETAAKGA